jgi:hypothetical protein
MRDKSMKDWIVLGRCRWFADFVLCFSGANASLLERGGGVA